MTTVIITKPTSFRCSVTQKKSYSKVRIVVQQLAGNLHQVTQALQVVGFSAKSALLLPLQQLLEAAHDDLRMEQIEFQQLADELDVVQLALLDAQRHFQLVRLILRVDLAQIGKVRA